MSDKLRYRLEVLTEKHAIGGFTCEDEDINEYARQVALEA